MKVRAIKDYPDGELKEIVPAGKEFEVSTERGKFLMEAGLVEAIGNKRPTLLDE